MSALETVEAEVRELVRRRGLDPLVDKPAVRRLVDDVLTDYSDRTLTSALPPVVDRAATAREVLDNVAGLGPLQRHLDDPTVEEIWINEPGRVFVARRGRSELTTTILSEGQVRDLVERMLKTTGRRVDLSTPFVDAMLPDGSRLHVVIPDIAYGVRGRRWSRPCTPPDLGVRRAAALDRTRPHDGPTAQGRPGARATDSTVGPIRGDRPGCRTARHGVKV